MSDLQLFLKLSSLPPDLRKEVQDFIEFLSFKTKIKKPMKRRKFGAAKGMFKMSSDFDAPMPDLQEYS